MKKLIGLLVVLLSFNAHAACSIGTVAGIYSYSDQTTVGRMTLLSDGRYGKAKASFVDGKIVYQSVETGTFKFITGCFVATNNALIKMSSIIQIGNKSYPNSGSWAGGTMTRLVVVK